MPYWEEFVQFLETQGDAVAEEFQQNIIMSEEDRLKEMIHLNGRMMFQLVVKYLRGQIELEEVRHLACRVAQERIIAESNIGDFVHNVCLGRNIMLKQLQTDHFPQDILLPAVIKMNECFDCFLEHAVSHYTELKNNALEEKQLFIEQSHKDKLTILGQMASTFVHEFRNPLTSVIGFSKFLKQEYPDLKYVDIMMSELDQLNYRVSQFLLVSKKGVMQKKLETFLLGHLFDEILTFLHPNFVDVNVEVVTEIEEGLTLTGHREEMKQVCINLLLNALDVLHKEQGPKRIAIRAQKIGRMKRIAISNNGAPIPPDSIDVIFEPFFTTKELGSGIGLYVCKQIVENHAGMIWCESDKEKTTFTMEFQQ